MVLNLNRLQSRGDNEGVSVKVHNVRIRRPAKLFAAINKLQESQLGYSITSEVGAFTNKPGMPTQALNTIAGGSLMVGKAGSGVSLGPDHLALANYFLSCLIFEADENMDVVVRPTAGAHDTSGWLLTPSGRMDVETVFQANKVTYRSVSGIIDNTKQYSGMFVEDADHTHKDQTPSWQRFWANECSVIVIRDNRTQETLVLCRSPNRPLRPTRRW